MEQEPKPVNTSSQEKIIETIATQIKDVSRNIMLKVSRGEINAEEGKKQIMEQVGTLLNTPFDWNK